MFTYDEAKKYLVEHLTRDIENHNKGDFQKIGKNFEVLDLNLPRNSGPEFKKLFIALNFWDIWLDARNHEWRYYKGISQSDWPLLAKSIIQNIEEEKEVTSPVILNHFDLKPPARGFKNKKQIVSAVILSFSFFALSVVFSGAPLRVHIVDALSLVFAFTVPLTFISEKEDIKKKGVQIISFWFLGTLAWFFLSSLVIVKAELNLSRLALLLAVSFVGLLLFIFAHLALLKFVARTKPSKR